MAKLGSPKAVHKAQGQAVVERIEREAIEVKRLAKAGSCTSAYLHYAEMKRAEGAAEAHAKAGVTIWMPYTSLKEAGGAFSDNCVRISGRSDASIDGVPLPHAPIRRPKEPPPVFHQRQGAPPGVPALKGARHRRRR